MANPAESWSFGATGLGRKKAKKGGLQTGSPKQPMSDWRAYLNNVPPIGFAYKAWRVGIASSGKYSFVVSCVALDERNEALAACLKGTGISNLSDWSSLFQGKARFVVFNHQQWVDWVRGHDDNAQWRDWLSYMESRYAYGELAK